MPSGKYLIFTRVSLLLGAFIIVIISGRMDFYDLILISTTLAEKGILTDNVQRLVVILSIFGGIFAFFGGITYFLQMKTDKSLEVIDESQLHNFQRIINNQDLIEDLIRDFFRISTNMQQEMIEKIISLEKDIDEIKEIIKNIGDISKR